MPASNPTNAEIADRLTLFAALLDIAGTNTFAVRAYERAAALIRTTPADVAELVRAGRIRELRGIGPGIEMRLRELVETGEIAELSSLEAELQPALVAYGRSLGLTAKRTLGITRDLGVTSVDELERAIADGRLQEASGVGSKTEERITAARRRGSRPQRGLTLDRSRSASFEIAEALAGEIAGAPRRFCELTHELRIVSSSERPDEVIERFARLPTIVLLLERDARRAVGLTIDGLPVALTVAEPQLFGTELFRETGSSAYVQPLEPLPPARDEFELFERLGLPYCPPELRETAGAQAPGGVVERERIRGDLHCHTRWSDGKASIDAMARAAIARGYEYLAICDHTPNVRVVPGLGTDDLRRQGEEIASVNERLAPFRVLRGVECDILADGSLDADDALLRELDWVQLSLHAGQRRSRAELTRIVTEAMRHPAVRALSHPKGRILQHRPENALDLDAVFAASIECNVALEVNGLPDRLDLSATHVREAVAAGVDLVLNSDAHSERGLVNLDLAVATARKGGATSDAVVNCRPVEQVCP